jgi:integrase
MTINFELRDRTDRHGLSQIRVVIQDRGKRIYVPLKVKVSRDQWDGKNQRVIRHPNEAMINNVLRLKMAELQAKSVNGSIDHLLDRKVTKTSLYQFAGECLHRWEKTKAPGSIKAYRSMLKAALSFEKVFIEDITPDWLARYEDFCRKECKDGGTLKRIAFISVIIKEAIRKGLIEKDPFTIYKKPPKKNPPKVWLTLDELRKIEKLARETKSQVIENTSWWFLFACYTGLRYSDVANFSIDLIQDGRLILYTQKTGEVVSIKMTTKIKELIGKIKNRHVYCNQLMNKYLKSVAHHSGIKKHITFHTARHTFAVNCANLGISQEVAAKLLGHSDLKTTSIYYKIINSRVDQEMKRWEI